MNGRIESRTSERTGKRSYRAVYYVDQQHGGAGRRYCAWRGKEREAVSDLTDALSRYRDGSCPEPSAMTVAELFGRWTAEHVSSLRPGSQRNYATCVQGFIVPEFGERVAAQVSPSEISVWLAGLLRDGRRDGRGGMAPKYVRQVRFVMHSAYKWAVSIGELPRNPVDAVRGPSVPRREFEPPTSEMVARVLPTLEGTRYYVPVAMAAWTGMRRGEILGLSWRQVDLRRGVVKVRRQLVADGTDVALTTLKTKAAIRDLDLPGFVVTILRREVARQKDEAMLRGLVWSEDAFVCQGDDCGPQHPEYFSRGFAGMLSRRGFIPFRFHDLRHAWATMLLEMGERAEVVQEQLGHASVGITCIRIEGAEVVTGEFNTTKDGTSLEGVWEKRRPLRNTWWFAVES